MNLCRLRLFATCAIFLVGIQVQLSLARPDARGLDHAARPQLVVARSETPQAQVGERRPSRLQR